MKFLLSWFVLSNIMGSYFAGLIALALIYFIIDKFFFGFTRSFLTIFLRKKRIRYYLGELKLNPQNTKSMYELGQPYFEGGDFKKSIDYLQKAMPKFPNSPQLFAYLGMSQICLKEFDEGKSNLEKAISIEKGVLYGLPYVYLIAWELDRNEVDYNKINEYEAWIERYSIPENYYRLGTVYSEKSLKQKSKTAFEKALESYKHCSRTLRKPHRKWAIKSKIRRYPAIVPLSLLVMLLLSSLSGYALYKYISKPSFQMPNPSLTNLQLKEDLSTNDLKNLILSLANYRKLAIHTEMYEFPLRLAIKMEAFKNPDWPIAFKQKVSTDDSFSLKNDQNIFMQNILFYDNKNNSITILRNCNDYQDLMRFFDVLTNMPNCSFTLLLGNKFPAYEMPLEYADMDEEPYQPTEQSWELILKGSSNSGQVKLASYSISDLHMNVAGFIDSIKSVKGITAFQTNSYKYKTSSLEKVNKIREAMQKTNINLPYEVEYEAGVPYINVKERAWQLAPIVVYYEYLK